MNTRLLQKLQRKIPTSLQESMIIFQDVKNKRNILLTFIFSTLTLTRWIHLTQEKSHCSFENAAKAG